MITTLPLGCVIVRCCSAWLFYWNLIVEQNPRLCFDPHGAIDPKKIVGRRNIGAPATFLFQGDAGPSQTSSHFPNFNVIDGINVVLFFEWHDMDLQVFGSGQTTEFIAWIVVRIMSMFVRQNGHGSGFHQQFIQGIDEGFNGIQFGQNTIGYQHCIAGRVRQ